MNQIFPTAISPAEAAASPIGKEKNRSENSGNLREHFVFTVYLDYRTIANLLGITGQNGVEKQVREYARKKSSPTSRNGRVTKYELSGMPGTVIFENEKRCIVNDDATLIEIGGS